MKKLIVLLLILTVSVCTAGGLGYYYYSCRIAEPRWETGKATRGPIRKIVSATGALAALETVDVGCQTSGLLASVTVNFNDTVTTGQLLAIIDAESHEAGLNQALANLEGVRSTRKTLELKIVDEQTNLEMLQAEIEVQSTAIKKARINLETSQRNLSRVAEIFKKKMVPQADLDDAKSSVELAKLGVEASLAQMKQLATKRVAIGNQILGIKAQMEGSDASVRQAEAQVRIARTNLARTRIYSPIDGFVLSKKVSAGQTVAANFQTPTLFTIARDLKKMQIEALIDESDVCRVLPGQVATFTVDPFPDRKFEAIVREVYISPKTEDKIMYPVILDLENPDRVLKPGLTTKLEILVESREDVLRVPTEALFFTPPAEILQRFPPKDEDLTGTETNTIWILERDTGAKPIEIHAGISNANFTEVLEGPVASGATVIRFKHEWWMGWFNPR